MWHRGPDSEGVVEGDGWVMGIRRLAIIDVAQGDQPLANEDKTVWVVCNGEIYNHWTLRQDLQSRGHRFRSRSDAEVIVHLYEEYGEHFVDHLQGMFALFLATPEGCYVARDRLGIKPLYHVTTPDGIFFASEIRALLQLPGVPAASTDPSRLADFFFFRYIPEPRTAFVGINRFPAGQVMHLSPQGVRIRTYWRAEPKSLFKGSFEEAVEEYESLLKRVVSMHLMSERPVGVFLSGGLDSSTLSALVANQTGQKIVLLSASFPGSEQDEAVHARLVAQHLGAEHHVIELPAIGLDTWMRAVSATEDLIADPACIPTLMLAHQARKHLTVALVGEGSDEMNLGYASYLNLQRGLNRRQFTKYLPMKPREERWARRLGYPNLEEIGFLARFTNLSLPLDEYPALVFGLPNPEERICEEINRITSRACRSTFWKNRLYRIEGWMKDDLLIKVDKNTMAASIEARVPFLDHTIVEWSFGIPEELALRNGKTKAVLRSLAAKLLPEKIMTRRQHGFIVPLDRLLNCLDLRELLARLRRPEALWRAVFQEHPVLSLLKRFEQGDPRPRSFIYQLFTLELWRERWLN
jgi:asparagine synthase (glutamine-hydrolysing)